MKLEKKTAAVLISIVFSLAAVSGVAGVYQFEDFIHSGGTHYLELREFMRDEGAQWKAVWVTRGSLRALERVVPMYLVGPFGKPIWEGEMRYLNPEGGFLKAEEIDGLVVVSTVYMNSVLFFVPDYVFNPPWGWDLVFESRNGFLRRYATGL